MKERDRILAKTNGRCGYCGEELAGKFHVDHIQPVRRNKRYDLPTKRWIYTGMDNPELDCFENKMAACQSCNINKHQYTVEEFREAISAYMKHLNNQSTQYKMAKRYNLVQETVKPITFYFETITNQNH